MKAVVEFIIEKITNLNSLYLNIGYLFTLFLTKHLITSVVFPSLLYIILGYSSGAIIILSILNLLGFVKINNTEITDLKGILSYSLCYGLSLLTSIIALHKLTLPTFAFIKGTSIIFTCIINYQAYNLIQNRRSHLFVVIIMLMLILMYVTDPKCTPIGYISGLCHAYLVSEGKHIYNRKINHSIFNIPSLIFYSSTIIIIPIILFAHSNGDSAVVIFFLRHNFISASTLYLYIFLSIVGILLNFMNLIPKERQSFDNSNYLKNIVGLISIFGGMIFTKDYIFDFFNFISLSLGFLCLSLLNLEVSKYYGNDHIQLLPHAYNERNQNSLE
uniref:7TM_GPCR_Srx domain-containing protein n=1 Tax=Parastrongyloides trichosuri TaxID=131310 RepID=A0A0N4ZYP5_PARTI